jgi:RNA polymerase sigma-70 factor (ECF subfamily)
MIAKNHCLMQLRNNKYSQVELNEKVVAAQNISADKTELLEKDKLLNKMQRAVKQLNPEQQQCVILFYLEKKSYSEIVEITGFSLMKVKSSLQNGKRNLKKMMEE